MTDGTDPKEIFEEIFSVSPTINKNKDEQHTIVLPESDSVTIKDKRTKSNNNFLSLEELALEYLKKTAQRVFIPFTPEDHLATIKEKAASVATTLSTQMPVTDITKTSQHVFALMILDVIPLEVGAYGFDIKRLMIPSIAEITSIPEEIAKSVARIYLSDFFAMDQKRQQQLALSFVNALSVMNSEIQRGNISQEAILATYPYLWGATDAVLSLYSYDFSEEIVMDIYKALVPLLEHVLIKRSFLDLLPGSTTEYINRLSFTFKIAFNINYLASKYAMDVK